MFLDNNVKPLSHIYLFIVFNIILHDKIICRRSQINDYGKMRFYYTKLFKFIIHKSMES